MNYTTAIIAWRNLWRHRIRSLAIIVSVAFGLWASLFLKGYANGLVAQRIQNVIHHELSHIQIHHASLSNDFDPRYCLNDSRNIVDSLARNQRIRAVTGRLVAKGMLASSTSNTGVVVSGINPALEEKVTGLSTFLVQGEYFPGKSSHEMLIGEKLAEKLKVHVGSKLVLTVVDAENTVCAEAFRIKGIYRTANAPFDEMRVFVNRVALYPITTLKDEYNEVAILLNSDTDIQLLTDSLQSNHAKDWRIEGWMDLAPEMKLYVNVLDESMFVFMGIIMLALAFAIVNTMLMAVMERTAEVGVLLALGMSRMRIFLMFFYESVFLVFTGVPFGVLAGWLTVTYYGVYGIDLSDHKAVLSSFGFSEQVYPHLMYADFLVMIQIVGFTALIAAVIPARRAFVLSPIRAIRK
jgi:putative ABC transport system permease protein